jgi:AcrR family transcriptional regulator
VSSKKAPSTRKDKALATRRRILAAAYDLLCEVGYAATTMAAIAERAGVAEQTLYFTFSNKPAIVTEVLHSAVVGLDRWTPTLDAAVHEDHLTAARGAMPWFSAFESEPDPRRAIERYFDATAEIFDRIGPLLTALGGLGLPEIRLAIDRSEALRVEAAGLVLGVLRKKGAGLRRDLKPARARDVFLVLTSGTLYRELTVGRGWTRKQATHWLVDLTANELLAG